MLKNMETMNTPSPQSDETEALEPAIIASLRDLGCEHHSPSSGSDLIIRRSAAAKMAAIRRRSRVRRITATITTMAACVFLGMYLNRTPEPANTETVDLARDDAAIILREVSALFPGQIRSIHRDETGLHLTLSETPNVESTMAIVIEIDGTSEIITFSGQTIEIMGQNVTVLADPERGILLNGQGIENWKTQHTPHLVVRKLSI